MASEGDEPDVEVEVGTTSGVRERASLPKGTIVGRYRTCEVIGAGGQGLVYRGEHLFLGYPVAIKVLRSSDISPVQRTRIKREARLGAGLHHPNIVAVLDAGELDDGSPYFVMEFIAGVCLSDLLYEQVLSPDATVELGVQLLSALTAIHQRDVIHRDIKPENIMLRREVDGFVTAKLLDFGISKSNDEQFGSVGPATRTGTLVGTPHYMSPEHVLGEMLDVRADLYSVAGVLYESISGAPPHDAPATGALIAKIATERVRPLRDVLPQCPKPLADAIDRGLYRERERRFMHPLEMADALRKAAAKLALARGADAWSPTFGQPRRSPGRPSLAPRKEPSRHDTENDSASISIAPLPPRAASLLMPDPPSWRDRFRGKRARWILLSALAAALAIVFGAIVASAWTQAEPPLTRASHVALLARPQPPSASVPHAARIEMPAPPPPSLAEPSPPEPAQVSSARPGEDFDTIERNARDSFVHGDTRRAIVLYRRVTDASPRRASAWRGLGLVSAAAGERASARRALYRYLSLAPNAGDRARIERELARLNY